MFDDFAIGYKDNKFYVLYWTEYIGQELPSNYEIQAFDLGEDFTVAKYAFYDSEGDQGNFELILFLKSSAATQLRKATMEIDTKNYSAVFTLIDDIEFTSPFMDRVLPQNFEISSLNLQG